MKIDKTIPVEMAFLHQAISVPGLLSSEKSLNHTRIRDIKMYLMPLGLAIELKGRQFMVPSANVAVALVEKEANA